MDKKSGMEVAADLAHLGKAAYDIIKALAQGGWHAAALQLLKHYWPQILAIAVVLLLIPVIVFCCLPMMMFGYASSTDTEIAVMTTKANEISAYYDQYESYIDDWVEHIKASNIVSGEQNTETSESDDDAEPVPEIRYEVEVNGEKIQKSWFIALHAVSIGNDLNAATEDDIRSFARKCVEHNITTTSENTETGAEIITKTLEIRHLSSMEVMSACGFSTADENWVRLIYKTLEGRHGALIGTLGSLFFDSSWRNCITSNYGPRTNPYTGFHAGVDIGMPMGTPICATKDGTVSTSTYNNGGYGYFIILDHGAGMQTLYAHCSELLVSVGDKVKKGDVIALVGSTGRSTGPHCHFEVRINGKHVDPLPYLP